MKQESKTRLGDNTTGTVDSRSGCETPCFIMDEQAVDNSVRIIRAALDRHWPGAILSYSVKTNSWPFLLRRLRMLGVWAEVVSPDEYRLASACGFPKSARICNGPAKPIAWMREVLQEGGMLHLDSVAELCQLRETLKDAPARIGLRINATEPDFAGEPLSGPCGSRFGISVRDGEMDETMQILRGTPHLRVTSLHLHCNTRTRSSAGFRWLARWFAALVRDFGLADVDTLDIGGSFGHDFDIPALDDGRWPSWDSYIREIAEELKSAGFAPNRLRLAIEPGSALISGCADYLTRIVGRRRLNGADILQCDGSRIHIDPHFTRNSFEGGLEIIHTAVNHDADNGKAPLCFTGSTCLEKDRIQTPQSLASASVSPGDILCIRKCGAYSYGLSPCLFIHTPPKVYIRHSDGNLKEAPVYPLYQSPR